MARDENEKPTCWKSCGRHAFVIFWVPAFLAVILSVSITQPMQFRAWGFAVFGNSPPVEIRGICSVSNSWTSSRYEVNYDVKFYADGKISDGIDIRDAFSDYCDGREVDCVAMAQRLIASKENRFPCAYCDPVGLCNTTVSIFPDRASAEIRSWMYLNTSLGVGLLTSSSILFICFAQFFVRVTLRECFWRRNEAEIQETTPILPVDKAATSYETPGEPQPWKYTVLKHV